MNLNQKNFFQCAFENVQRFSNYVFRNLGFYLAFLLILKTLKNTHIEYVHVKILRPKKTIRITINIYMFLT